MQKKEIPEEFDIEILATSFYLQSMSSKKHEGDYKGATDEVRGKLRQYFSENRGLFGGDCYVFNVAIKLVLDRDFTSLRQLLDVYNRASFEFLGCRSESNGKTVLHHVIEQMRPETALDSFECVQRLLNFHSMLVKNVDKDKKKPFEYAPFPKENLEYCVMQELAEHHDNPHVLDKYRIIFWLKHGPYKNILDFMNSYDEKKYTSALDSEINPFNGFTLAHYIAYSMNKDNFLKSYLVVVFLLQKYPKLKTQKNRDNQDLCKLLEAHNGTLPERQQLTNDQKMLFAQMICSLKEKK